MASQDHGDAQYLPKPIDSPPHPTANFQPPAGSPPLSYGAAQSSLPGHTPHYGQAGYPYPPQPVVHVAMYGGAAPTKSTGVAVLLAALFGPLGMLYSTIPGAAILFCVNLFLVLVGFVTVGLSWLLLFFSWIAGMVWAYLAADQHNKRVMPRPPYGLPQYPPQTRPY